jgi:hypothetical protein
VKFDGFCVIYLLGVFAIGSSSSIGFFRSFPRVNYMALVCNQLWVFVAGISEKWLQIRRFTFLKKCPSTTRPKIAGLLFLERSDFSVLI